MCKRSRGLINTIETDDDESEESGEDDSLKLSESDSDNEPTHEGTGSDCDYDEFFKDNTFLQLPEENVLIDDIFENSDSYDTDED